MKKRLMFAILASIITLSACSKEEQNLDSTTGQNKAVTDFDKSVTSVVTTDEYKKLDATERKIANYLNAAINGLKGYTLNKAEGKAIYASFSVSKDSPNFEYIALGIEEKGLANGRVEESCTACGFSSTVSCIKAIKKKVDEGGELTVTIKKSGDCYNITY